MKKDLKRIFKQYEIYNDKGRLLPLLKTELGKELFSDVKNLFKKANKNHE